MVLHKGKPIIGILDKNAGVSFNTNPPTVSLNGQLTTNEGCSAISDANGNLLFYTDGITIWNENHMIMEQGLLEDRDSTTSALIVPHPINPDLYYVFTIGAANVNNQGLNYSVVDMNLNNGLGDVVPNQKNIHLAAYPTGIDASEKLTATTGAGCAEYWVLSRSKKEFYAFKVDGSGVHPPVISKVGPVVPAQNGMGYMKFDKRK